MSLCTKSIINAFKRSSVIVLRYLFLIWRRDELLRSTLALVTGVINNNIIMVWTFGNSDGLHSPRLAFSVEGLSTLLLLKRRNVDLMIGRLCMYFNYYLMVVATEQQELRTASHRTQKLRSYSSSYTMRRCT